MGFVLLLSCIFVLLVLLVLLVILVLLVLKSNFLNGPNKLAFVRIAGSTFISLVGPLYFYLRFMLLLGCIFVLLVFSMLLGAFSSFYAFLCFFYAFLCFFVLLVCVKSFWGKKFKIDLIISFILLLINKLTMVKSSNYLIFASTRIHCQSEFHLGWWRMLPNMSLDQSVPVHPWKWIRVLQYL